MQPFYDCHFHVQNLTHPHLEAFIDRLRNDSKIAQLLLKPIDPALIDAMLLVAPLAGMYRIIKRVLKGIGGNLDQPTEAHLRILNLLVLMNRPIDEYFLAVDEEISELLKDPAFGLKGQRFDHFMLSALIMDFTDRDYSSSWTKTIPYAQETKPVVRQTEDLLAGMKRYRETLRSRGMQPKLTVLPFLGMNPENYGLAPEHYAMLTAKLDQGSAPHIFNTAQSKHKAFYTPASGRLTWLKDEMSDQDVADLIAAIVPGQDAQKVTVTEAAIRDLKAGIDAPLTTVSLLVALDVSKLEADLQKKFDYEAKGQGGLLTWKAKGMKEGERKSMIDALKKPADPGEADIRKQSAYTYSVGRIEFLFRSLESKDKTTIQDLMNRYFGAKQVTKADVLANQEMWSGKLEDMKPGLFAGVKLYPPLGFDPNPGDDEHIHINSRKKRAWYLYKFCQDRQIPLTVHTSDGGFQIMDEALHFKFTSPERWKGVLRNFPNLRINFAHCGVQDAIMNKGDHAWKRILFKELMCAKKADGSWAYPNVYSDVSDLLNTKEAYQQWEEGMAALQLSDEEWEHVSNRLLFGSDFMINLRESECYSNYVSRFVKNEPQSFPALKPGKKLQFMNEDLRYKMSVTNPERFLFPNG